MDYGMGLSVVTLCLDIKIEDHAHVLSTVDSTKQNTTA